jgi:hypothetical protein
MPSAPIEIGVGQSHRFQLAQVVRRSDANSSTGCGVQPFDSLNCAGRWSCRTLAPPYSTIIRARGAQSVRSP